MDEKVLIVDDDEKLRNLLMEYLGGYGFQTTGVPDGIHIMETLAKEKPHIVILDLMLPGKDGFEILGEIRRGTYVPVIMLTARGEETDRIVGLEMGADDYLPKPFNPRELMARMRTVLRRGRNPDESPVAKPDSSSAGAELGDGKSSDLNSTAGETGADERVLRVGGLVLDREARTLLIRDQEASLSTAEFLLMEAFMENPGRVLSRDELMNLTRGRDFMAFERSIDVHVSRIRARLRKYAEHKNRIKTIWGTGYLFQRDE